MGRFCGAKCELMMRAAAVAIRWREIMRNPLPRLENLETGAARIPRIG